MKMSKIVLGIENIENYLYLFKNRRVGLITNPTGITSDFVSSIDVLSKHTSLVALFSPEHGVRANLQAGVYAPNYVDDETGIMVYSLYGKNKKPSFELMDKIDVLCIDIQDAGSRYYTFIYTMAYAMMACAEYSKEFVVFDRPNPLGGVVEGNHLNIDKYRSFVGYYDIPQRYGLTIGECANLFNQEFNINCALHIIPMLNYKKDYDYYDTNLPWVVPTPNLPTIDSVYCYNATCIFEGTNVSEGRGTTTPFQLFGAPYINPFSLARDLNSYNLPGVVFRPQYFTPTFSKYQNELCGGIFLHITDKLTFKPVKTSFTLLHHIRNMYSNDFKINKPFVENKPSMFCYEAGDDVFIEDSITLNDQYRLIEDASNDFIRLREKYLLYK